MSDLVLDIRDYDHEREQSLVFDTWLNSYRRSHFRGPWPTDIYYRSGREAIERLVGPGARWGARTLIAFSPEDEPPNDVYGWICVESGFDRPVMHYVYTKEPYRKNGVARYLREQAGIALDSVFYFTHRTPNMPDVRDVFDGGFFKPEIFWNRKPAPVMNRNGSVRVIVPQRDERRGRRRDAQRQRRKEMEEFYAANRSE